jgi:hypothetical protein
MAETIEKSLLDVDFASLTRRTFTPSPAAWEDQVLYFLLLDRFSDGNEQGGYLDGDGRTAPGGVTSLYRPEDSGRVDYDTWLRAGGGWQGGTLQGLRSKLGYLRRLGITALWVSPVFRQVAFEPSYHGYGIQNFLDVDPHFGTREEFRDFVQAAHAQGIYVILDVVAHHTGNIFAYDPDRYATHDPTAGHTPSRASTTRTAGRRCRSGHPSRAAWRRPGRTGRSGPASSSGPNCTSARGTSRTGTTPQSSRGGHVWPQDAGPPRPVGRAVPAGRVGPPRVERIRFKGAIGVNLRVSGGQLLQGQDAGGEFGLGAESPIRDQKRREIGIRRDHEATTFNEAEVFLQTG